MTGKTKRRELEGKQIQKIDSTRDYGTYKIQKDMGGRGKKVCISQDIKEKEFQPGKQVRVLKHQTENGPIVILKPEN